jgi:hypothetical protein
VQSLQQKKKTVISIGVISCIVGIGTMMAIVQFIPIQTNEGNNLSTDIGMPVPGNTVPEMIVSDDFSISTGMPVPGENPPEMIIVQNVKGFPRITK